MAKKKSVTEIILEDFGGSRTSGAFKEFTDEEFVGYVAGVTKLNNLNMDVSVLEVLKEVRMLHKNYDVFNRDVTTLEDLFG